MSIKEGEKDMDHWVKKEKNAKCLTIEIDFKRYQRVNCFFVVVVFL